MVLVFFGEFSLKTEPINFKELSNNIDQLIILKNLSSSCFENSTIFYVYTWSFPNRLKVNMIEAKRVINYEWCLKALKLFRAFVGRKLHRSIDLIGDDERGKINVDGIYLFWNIPALSLDVETWPRKPVTLKY